MSAPPAASAPGTSVPPVASAPPDADANTPPGPLAADLGSCIVVVPSGGAYLVLRAGPEQTGDGVAFAVLYHAGVDAQAAGNPAADAGLALAAGELLEAFGPLADAVQAGRLSIVAISGRPGERGVVERRGFVRDAGRWRRSGARG